MIMTGETASRMEGSAVGAQKKMTNSNGSNLLIVRSSMVGMRTRNAVAKTQDMYAKSKVNKTGLSNMQNAQE